MFERKKISIIAGRPGRGKTSYALKTAKELQEYYKKNVMYISAEGLSTKYLENMKDVFLVKVAYKTLDAYIMDIAETKQLMEKEGKSLDVVFIDYLQLIPIPVGTQQGISLLFKMFKEIAERYNIHIVLITQCQRNCDKKDFGKLNKEVEDNIDEDTELIYVYNFKYDFEESINDKKNKD